MSESENKECNAEPSNFQLQLAIRDLHGDVKLALSQFKDMKTDIAAWQLKHENDDKEVHEKLHTRISNMKLASTGMSIVSVIIGLFTGMKIK